MMNELRSTPKSFAGNQSFLKELNLLSSLRLIRSIGPISRAELADRLGLNRSTMTSIIGQLAAQHLVQEVGTGLSTGGRPPRMLRFNAEAGYIISIDWTPRTVRLNVADLGGNVYYTQHLPYSTNREVTDQIQQVITLLQEACSKLPPKPYGLLGIGMGVPGVIDNGAVSSYDMQWTALRLSDYFTPVFDCPVITENIAHAGLIAERDFGCSSGEDLVCYVRLDKGISAGLLYQQQIFRGNEGFVGQIGHTIISRDGQSCICGNRGCWQAYASEHALLQRYNAHIEQDDIISIGEYAQRVREGEVAALEVLQAYLQDLAIGLANTINLLNPGLIIIDSTLNTISDTWKDDLLRLVDQTALPFPMRRVNLAFSSLGEKMMVYAATALILDHVFSPPHLRSGH